jgi:hypothetical protein
MRGIKVSTSVGHFEEGEEERERGSRGSRGSRGRKIFIYLL